MGTSPTKSPSLLRILLNSGCIVFSLFFALNRVPRAPTAAQEEGTTHSISKRSVVLLFFGSLLVYALAVAPAAIAQGAQRTSVDPRIVGPIDESSLVTLRGNTHPLALPKFDRGPAPVSMPANRLLLILSRSTQQEA